MKRLAHLVSDLASTAGDASIQSMLDAATRGSVEALSVDGAGVVLLASPTSPERLAASDPAALRFEQLQSSLMQGPCFVAHHAMTAQSVPDLTLVADFPEFAAAAGFLGLSGVFAFPLRRDGVSLGALDLYRMSPGGLDPDEMRAAQDLADFLGDFLGDFLADHVAEAWVTSDPGTDPVSAGWDGELVHALHDERTFVATVVHELGSSLASIAGFTWLLENSHDDLSARQRHFVTGIHRNSDDLRLLTADLMTVLRLGAGAADGAGVRERVDLRTLVATTRDSLVVDPASTPAVSTRVPARPMLVHGDPRLLERVVANLLSNAIKYTPPEGTVTCALSQRGGYVTLEVRDTGIGIPAEDQAGLFTRFYRASNAKQQGISGNGLGLAIVKAVVQGHGGTVALSSALGEGTRVRVRLPVAKGELLAS